MPTTRKHPAIVARKLICIALGIAAYSLTSRANCEEAPLIAYGASASAEEVVAVRFAAMDGKLAPEIVQREPLGFAAAPIVFHDQHRLLYVASLRAKEAPSRRSFAKARSRPGGTRSKTTGRRANITAYFSRSVGRARVSQNPIDFGKI